MHNNFELFTYVDNLNKENIVKLDKKVQIIFRNYRETFKNQELKKFVYFCKKFNRKIYLSNNFKKAKELGFDGVYIPSFNKKYDHLSYSIHPKFIIIGSAHNLKEIKIKELQKVQSIFISSLFNKNKNYLGLNKFKIISRYTKKNIVALGGLSKKNQKKLKLINISDFAGISYFK